MSGNKGDSFKNLYNGDVSSIDMNVYRSLSPYVTFVAPLMSWKWSHTRTFVHGSEKTGLTVGYRFRAGKDICGIERYELIDGTKACSTDPSGYKQSDKFDVKSGEEFDLNLFETMHFFMRDDIFGLITGDGFEVYMYTRSTKKDYITAGLRTVDFGISIFKYSIYIDKKVGNVLTPLDGFEQYDAIYGIKTGRKSKDSPEHNFDPYTINILNLRKFYGLDVQK